MKLRAFIPDDVWPQGDSTYGLIDKIGEDENYVYAWDKGYADTPWTKPQHVGPSPLVCFAKVKKLSKGFPKHALRYRSVEVPEKVFATICAFKLEGD